MQAGTVHILLKLLAMCFYLVMKGFKFFVAVRSTKLMLHNSRALVAERIALIQSVLAIV